MSFADTRATGCRTLELRFTNSVGVAVGVQPNARRYNLAILFLGEINTGT
jgi:hypothetical protein